LPRKKYEKAWGNKYHRPGFFARILTVVFRLIPTVGPFKAFGFKPVPASGEQLFLQAFDATVERYRALLTQVRNGNLNLPNHDIYIKLMVDGTPMRPFSATTILPS
jgi:hypothetical protein